jgi:hypothetical protein
MGSRHSRRQSVEYAPGYELVRAAAAHMAAERDVTSPEFEAERLEYIARQEPTERRR